MKTLVALSLVTLLAAPTFVQSATAAPPRYDVFRQSNQTPRGSYEDLTQTGPIHRGPIYHGYPLSDWYVY